MAKNIIGLKRGVVKLKEHNPDWAKLFEKGKKLLLEKFPDIIIEIRHGGSTAIPGIIAKPIIDMFVAVSSLEKVKNVKIKKELEKLGYEFHGEADVAGRILYTKGKGETRTHHLHFVEKDSNEWKNYILIKEYFLRNPKSAQEYAKLKIVLAKKYPHDRKNIPTEKINF